MNTFLTIVGGVFVITLCLLVLAGVFFLCCGALEWALEKFTRTVEAETRARVASQLGNGSYWFSEDRNTMIALQLYSKSLALGYGDTGSIRDEWRREIAKPNE